jgi:hypothetical protein
MGGAPTATVQWRRAHLLFFGAEHRWRCLGCPNRQGALLRAHTAARAHLPRWLRWAGDLRPARRLCRRDTNVYRQPHQRRTLALEVRRALLYLQHHTRRLPSAARLVPEGPAHGMGQSEPARRRVSCAEPFAWRHGDRLGMCHAWAGGDVRQPSTRAAGSRLRGSLPAGAC